MLSKVQNPDDKHPMAWTRGFEKFQPWTPEVSVMLCGGIDAPSRALKELGWNVTLGEYSDIEPKLKPAITKLYPGAGVLWITCSFSL